VPVEVAENVEVKEGDIVAVLDYEGLEAEMKIAWADYLQAVRTKKEKLREKERWEKLYEEGKGPATEQQRDKAVWEYDVAVEDANSNKATFESKAWDYKQTFVKAPFDGVVSVRYADKGAVLVSGKPLLRLIHLDRLKVMAYVPNRYIGADGIRAGVTKVEIVLESEGGSAAAENGVITATVTKVYEESNRPTRANPIEIDISNMKEDGVYQIRGNMYARVSFFVRTVEDAVRVRSDAIFEIEKDKYVFVVEDGVARRKKVETGIREKGFVEVVGGLNGGEKVVVVGQNKLAEGTKVNVVSEEYKVAPVRE
jgi:membrane fusion protein (multidrug efflux system)